MKQRTIAALALVVTVGLTQAVNSRLSAGAAQGGGQGTFTFALIGDMPYGAEGDAKFPNVSADINADHQLSFVVHDGDFKNGSSLCSDAVFFNRLDLFKISSTSPSSTSPATTSGPTAIG